MNTTISIDSNPKASLDFSIEEILCNPGVYKPTNKDYGDVYIVITTKLELYVNANIVCPLNVKAWEAIRFVKTDAVINLSFSN